VTFVYAPYGFSIVTVIINAHIFYFHLTQALPLHSFFTNCQLDKTIVRSVSRRV